MNKPAKVHEAIVSGDGARVEAYGRAGGKAAARNLAERRRRALDEADMLAVKRVEEEEAGVTEIQLQRRESNENILPVE